MKLRCTANNETNMSKKFVAAIDLSSEDREITSMGGNKKITEGIKK